MKSDLVNINNLFCLFFDKNISSTKELVNLLLFSLLLLVLEPALLSLLHMHGVNWEVVTC